MPATKRRVARHGIRGAALLEAIVALAILGIAGTSLTALLAAAIRQQGEAIARERTTREADRLLTAYSLLTRDDLDRRLGRRPAGRFAVEVQRPEPTLYRLGIVDTAAVDVELLVTVVFRPASR